MLKFSSNSCPQFGKEIRDDLFAVSVKSSLKCILLNLLRCWSVHLSVLIIGRIVTYQLSEKKEFRIRNSMKWIFHFFDAFSLRDSKFLKCESYEKYIKFLNSINWQWKVLPGFLEKGLKKKMHCSHKNWKKIQLLKLNKKWKIPCMRWIFHFLLSSVRLSNISYKRYFKFHSLYSVQFTHNSRRVFCFPRTIFRLPRGLISTNYNTSEHNWNSIGRIIYFPWEIMQMVKRLHKDIEWNGASIELF